MESVILPSGESVPALGMGTWNMGDAPTRRDEEIATLRLGLDQGMGLIDTAELYGDGRSEQLVGEAIQGRRDEVFLVSKVLPSNANRRAAMQACERSLQRLKTDRIDLYLLHWRGTVPLRETMEAFMALQQTGKIRYYGVSNFDLSDMRELLKLPGANQVQTNQVLYNLTRRNIEWDLVPWMRQHQIPVMAYSPIEQARLLVQPKLIKFAHAHGMTPAQVALTWLLIKGAIVIPKTSHRQRLLENLKSLDHSLTPQQLEELDVLFPPPSGPKPMEML